MPPPSARLSCVPSSATAPLAMTLQHATHLVVVQEQSEGQLVAMSRAVRQRGGEGAHKMRSAPTTVDRRCAMTRTVWSLITRSSASCTTASLSESSALVAWQRLAQSAARPPQPAIGRRPYRGTERAAVTSSSRRTVGLRTSALAMAIRCFCPPDRDTPFSPQSCDSHPCPVCSL